MSFVAHRTLRFGLPRLLTFTVKRIIVPGALQFSLHIDQALPLIILPIGNVRSARPRAAILVSTLQFHSMMQFSLQDATANNNLTFTFNPRSCRLKEYMKDGTKRRMR
jgi:hypothetical protein